MDRVPFERDGKMFVWIDNSLYVMGSWGWQRSYA